MLTLVLRLRQTERLSKTHKPSEKMGMYLCLIQQQLQSAKLSRCKVTV